MQDAVKAGDLPHKLFTENGTEKQAECPPPITVTKKKWAEWENPSGCIEKFWRLAIKNNPRCVRPLAAGV